MPTFYLAVFGLIMASVGAGLVKLFGARANRKGIGSFTLLPLAGIAYVIGILCIVVGILFILIGLFG